MCFEMSLDAKVNILMRTFVEFMKDQPEKSECRRTEKWILYSTKREEILNAKNRTQKDQDLEEFHDNKYPIIAYKPISKIEHKTTFYTNHAS